jgi:hypothetical protein
MSNLTKLCKELESEIERTYTEGITMDEAERLAAKFLGAQLKVSDALKTVDLDCRMRKSGVKAVRAATYLKEIEGKDKKPTEATISAVIETNDIVSSEQDAFDKAEVNKAELERFYDIFLNAHIYYRGIAKGKFD